MSYVAVCWEGQVRPGWLQGLASALPPDWSVVLEIDAAWVAAGGPRAAAVLHEPWGVAVGEIYGAGSVCSRPSSGATWRARSLVDGAWGAYVALLLDDASGRWSVLRDPSGGLDALAWTKDQAVLVAGELPPWLNPWLPAGLQVDWDGLTALVAEPVRISADVALCGVEGIAPGELWSPGQGRVSIWTPGMVARRAGRSARELTEALPAIVDQVVQAMAGERSLIELSGGLDSAIIAASLGVTGRGPVAAINYFVRDLGGDERPFAEAMAQRWGIDLIEVEKPPPRFELAALAETAAGARPALNALDAEHDRDVAGRCKALGVDTIMTGQGGDHVFFQAPTALIAADMIGDGLGPKLLAVLARRLGVSAWTVLGQAMRARFGPSPARPVPAWLGERSRSALSRAPHPWLADLEGLRPAKALQAASLAAALSLQGASRRSDAARLRHPLLSQPVQEACLPVSIGALTGGGHDRALARAAFADRLPVCTVERVGKGRLTSHYGRGIAAGLGELRPLLLEGCLAAQRVIEPRRVEVMLSVEHLAWRGGFGAITSLAAIELWARAWEVRASVSRRCVGSA